MTYNWKEQWSKPWVIIVAIILILIGLFNMFLKGFDLSGNVLSILGDSSSIILGVFGIIIYFLAKK